MAKEHLLAVENVSKVYGNHRVVNQVSLQVDRGEVVGLMGRNGAGKTTTFRMVIGLVKPSHGNIRFRGDVVTKMPIYVRSRKGMGFLPQGRSVFKRLTVAENLLAILETRNKVVGDQRVLATQMLEEYGLTKVAGQKAYMLSGGETRRLELCRAMITNPCILMLDEPFSGVDPIAVGELHELIRRLRDQGVGILLADHSSQLPSCDDLEGAEDPYCMNTKDRRDCPWSPLPGEVAESVKHSNPVRRPI
jgi:lipopolysaccharide export system ATP-binding protein